MRHRERGITLVEVSALLIVLFIVVTMMLPPLLRGGRHAKIESCQAHLRALYQAQEIHAKGNPPFVAGREFWRRLSLTTPPLVAAETLRCPLVETPDPVCDYLGPSSEIGPRAATDPIGCDRDINHSADGKEGGCILLKSGEVLVDHKGLWGGALHPSRCRP